MLSLWRESGLLCHTPADTIFTSGFCQIHSFIPHPDSKPHNCFTRGTLDIGLTHGADSFAKIHSHYEIKETN